MCRIFHMQPTELLTTGQIADLLQVHRTTVHHWEKAGKITPVTIANGVRLFDSSVIDQLISERTS